MDVFAGPQQLVKINSRRRMNMWRSGRGSPTVVLAPGFMAVTADWSRVQPALARITQVVSYDHAGQGFSDPGPLPRSPAHKAADLKAALVKAGVGPPYVLVGLSMGNFEVRHFARRHPETISPVRPGANFLDSRRDICSRFVLMSPPDPNTVDAAEALLGRLAGLDVSLAEHVHACAMSTEDPHEVAELAKAYHRVARSARQSIALHAQLKRAREAAERENAPPPEPPRLDRIRIARRTAEVREAVRRVIWDETEAESLDEELLLSVLENNLRITGERPDFPDPDLDDHVVAVCSDLRLPLAKALAWRDLPDPPPDMGCHRDDDAAEYADTG
jgi:pimeloyl-ACP methyl ester carboxylesterase